MKKIVLMILAAFALVTFSCKSTATDNDTKSDVEKAFASIYNDYAENLVLDDAETYTVKNGDTLTAITKSFYGADKGYYFPMIMLASRDVVLDPDLIEPGMELTIPDFEANINDEDNKPKLKAFFKEIANVYEQKGKSVDLKTRDALLELSESM